MFTTVLPHNGSFCDNLDCQNNSVIIYDVAMHIHMCKYNETVIIWMFDLPENEDKYVYVMEH